MSGNVCYVFYNCWFLHSCRTVQAFGTTSYKSLCFIVYQAAVKRSQGWLCIIDIKRACQTYSEWCSPLNLMPGFREKFPVVAYANHLLTNTILTILQLPSLVKERSAARLHRYCKRNNVTISYLAKYKHHNGQILNIQRNFHAHNWKR